jgi:hypothetical protein
MTPEFLDRQAALRSERGNQSFQPPKFLCYVNFLKDKENQLKHRSTESYRIAQKTDKQSEKGKAMNTKNIMDKKERRKTDPAYRERELELQRRRQSTAEGKKKMAEANRKGYERRSQNEGWMHKKRDQATDNYYKRKDTVTDAAAVAPFDKKCYRWWQSRIPQSVKPACRCNQPSETRNQFGCRPRRIF